jgi:hypothetical protein
MGPRALSAGGVADGGLGATASGGAAASRRYDGPTLIVLTRTPPGPGPAAGPGVTMIVQLEVRKYRDRDGTDSNARKTQASESGREALTGSRPRHGSRLFTHSLRFGHTEILTQTVAHRHTVTDAPRHGLGP